MRIRDYIFGALWGLQGLNLLTQIWWHFPSDSALLPILIVGSFLLAIADAALRDIF